MIQQDGIFKKMECVKTILVRINVANKMIIKWRNVGLKWQISSLGHLESIFDDVFEMGLGSLCVMSLLREWPV